MAEFERPSTRLGADRLTGTELIAQATELKDIALGQGLVVVLGRELECQDTEVREVLPVDTGQRLGDDDAQTQVARGDHGMFTRGSLTVVLTADDGMTAIVRRGTRGIGVVDLDVDELGDLGNVAAIGQNTEPAGMISSVETLSPTLSRISRSMSSGSGSKSGSEEMFEPLTSSTSRASSTGSGGTSMDLLAENFSGSRTCG